jgi:hypothetical protein
MKTAAEPRLVEVPEADGNFATGEPAVLQPESIAAVAEPVLEFVNALQSGNVSSCKLPLANPPGQGAVQLSESAAAGIAAQIAILDEDDSIIYEAEPFGIVADAAAVNGQQQQQAAAQQLLQQHAQMQLQQALAAQQQLAAVVASKAGLHLQQAAAQRAAAAAGSAAAAGALQQSFGIQLSKLPGSGSGSQGSVGPVVLSGVPAGILTGGLTPQMLAAAQAVAAAQAKQGIRPGGGAQLVVPAGATVQAAQQQQQQQQGSDGQ